MAFQEQASSLSEEQIVSLLIENQSFESKVSSLESKLSEAEQQLAWFKKQLFGQKSEKRVFSVDPRQLCLGEFGKSDVETEQPKVDVTSYARGKAKKKPLEGSPEDSGLRFGPEVPVEVIEIPNPELAGLSEEDYEVISEKASYKLAQNPGSYVVIKYVRKTIKKKTSKELITPLSPPAVIEKSFADVSFLVGMLIDKFLYHLPLYRQHQRLADSDIVISRATLTNLVHRSIELLVPIYEAQYSSILESDIVCLDETPVKASRKVKGKMNTSYYWPLFGDKDEICFAWRESRAHSHVEGLLEGFSGILLTDGYQAYENYANSEEGVILAQCWSHTRRKFVDALENEPVLANIALEFIGELYKFEKEIRRNNLEGSKKLLYRVVNSKPTVEKFFSWLDDTLVEYALLPSSPLTVAANYAFKREEELKVFLRYPDVRIDTNHQEREIRPIAMGRKNWHFCWTEVGAKYVGIIQSLIRTCILHKIDPYKYLVDVLQRIDSHPQSQVQLLTPRLWKEHFANSRIKTPLQFFKETSCQDTS